MEAKAKRGLREGFTTGTAAAAAAKAATAALLDRSRKTPASVVVTLPQGGTLDIPIRSVQRKGNSARAVVVKDAGDDPDVTNGAEIVSTVELKEPQKSKKKKTRLSVVIKGGDGVGTVTKPGLAIPPGRPAINPVPLKMIRTALREAARGVEPRPKLTVTVSVPKGAELAEKTMNARLGIMGGISILGTTGIVRPLSLAAYCHSILSALDVAVAAGLTEIVFSTGRSSERVAEKEYTDLPLEAFLLTGDHMGFALEEAAKRREVKRVVIAGQFGKFSKLARGEFATHCSDSSVEFGHLAELAREAGAGSEMVKRIEGANTTREVFFMLKDEGFDVVLDDVSRLVRSNAQKIIGKRVECGALLVGYDGKVTARAG